MWKGGKGEGKEERGSWVLTIGRVKKVVGRKKSNTKLLIRETVPLLEGERPSCLRESLREVGLRRSGGEWGTTLRKEVDFSATTRFGKLKRKKIAHDDQRETEVLEIKGLGGDGFKVVTKEERWAKKEVRKEGAAISRSRTTQGNSQFRRVVLSTGENVAPQGGVGPGARGTKRICFLQREVTGDGTQDKKKGPQLIFDVGQRVKRSKGSAARNARHRRRKEPKGQSENSDHLREASPTTESVIFPPYRYVGKLFI